MNEIEMYVDNLKGSCHQERGNGQHELSPQSFCIVNTFVLSYISAVFRKDAKIGKNIIK